MATVTKTFRENGGALVDYSTPSEGATWTVSIVGADYNVFNDSGLLEIADPTMTAKYVQYSSDAAKRRAYIDCKGQILINGVSYLGAYAYLTKRRADGAATSGTTYTIAKRSDSSFPFSVDLTKVFNANTPTLKTAAITLPSYNMWLESYYGGTASSSPTNDSYYQGSLSFGTIGYVYYKCPPELATCNILKDTPSGYYANHTNVTIEVPITYSTVSQSGTAKYGGYIKKIEATIGTESSVLTFDESTKPTSKQTLTLNPTIVGNDIPVSVTVTDSRDQSTTQSLGTINVLTYNKPSVGFDVYRTDNVGKKTDEGAYAIIDAQVTYTPDLTTIKQKPTITVDGVDKTSNVTWYSSWTANEGVVSESAISSWSSISSGSKIYGLINSNLLDTNSYQITMTAVDTLNGVSDPVTQTLSTAFYTIDFQAGGKEIAFGAPANDNLTNVDSNDYSNEGLFKCRMHTLFEQDINTNGDVNADNINANSDVNADNIIASGNIEASGDVTVGGHSSPIGTMQVVNVTTGAIVANIDTYTSGASVTLEAGSYIIYCYGSMGTNSSATQLRAIRLYRVSPNAAGLWSWRNVFANGNWATISATLPMQLIETTTLRVDASASVTANSASTWIIAVRIA